MAAIPVVSEQLRGNAHEVCRVDGRRVEEPYQVSVFEGQTELHFCCLECARIWWKKISRERKRSLRVEVCDEVSGHMLEAAAAHYVDSTVITHRASGNHTHAFASRSSAIEHAKAYSGTVLEDSPFKID